MSQGTGLCELSQLFSTRYSSHDNNPNYYLPTAVCLLEILKKVKFLETAHNKNKPYTHHCRHVMKYLFPLSIRHYFPKTIYNDTLELTQVRPSLTVPWGK